MIARLKTITLAAFALASLGLAGTASAMPMQGLQSALAAGDEVAIVEPVRLVCRPYRPCFYVPGYRRSYGYYRPRGFYRPYGYRPFYRHHRYFY